MKRSCYDYSLLLLQYRARSEKEMRQRLAQKKYSDNDIEETIEKLKRYKFIDDNQFAENYVKSQSRNLKGRYLIKSRLLNKGIERDIINENLIKYDADEELEAAIKLARKLSKTYKSKDIRKESRRIAQYLARRGFSPSVIYKVIDKKIPLEELESIE